MDKNAAERLMTVAETAILARAACPAQPLELTKELTRQPTQLSDFAPAG